MLTEPFGTQRRVCQHTANKRWAAA
jgi:hypothetical protein